MIEKILILTFLLNELGNFLKIRILIVVLHIRISCIVSNFNAFKEVGVNHVKYLLHLGHFDFIIVFLLLLVISIVVLPQMSFGATSFIGTLI